MQDNCIFCKIISGQIPGKKVFEDDHVLAIEDINPKAPVHVLVIPKTHVVTMDGSLSAQACAAMFNAVAQLKQTVAKDHAGFNIVSNNGRAAGQSVDHLHWHFLSGKNIYSSGFSL